MSGSKRWPTRLQIANRRLHRAEGRHEKLREQAYQLFRSATAYARANQLIPPGAATLVLASQWCQYTGYAPRETGTYLLRRLDWAAKVFGHRTKQRDDVLSPQRARRLTHTPPEAGVDLSHRPSGLRAHPEEVAFWATIRTEPRERCAWLVYADWLEEQGDSTAARAVRQCHQVRVHGMRRPTTHGQRPGAYVGTVDGAEYPLGPEGWRDALTRRGKVVPGGSLVAAPCHGESAGRYKVFAIN
jgi:uncharacterized protein (TIGR02996 family)